MGKTNNKGSDNEDFEEKQAEKRLRICIFIFASLAFVEAIFYCF